MGSLDGRVAIVTGAGRGIGRSVALLLASEGMSVVVNDLGGALDGSGSDSGPAREVAEAITGSGGRAVASGADVSDHAAAEALIKTAISEFGRLDVLVNAAGILRDRMVFNMSEEEWDAVIRVHLKGHFCPTRHAVEHWRNQSKATGAPVYGRIVNTSSEAGLLGSPLDSSEFESYGESGPGRYITIYANAGHVYMWIAGLWFDTAAQSSSNGHDRWSATRISPLSGYIVRHPVGE